jgi:hypothetical protein
MKVINVRTGLPPLKQVKSQGKTNSTLAQRPTSSIIPERGSGRRH